MLRLHRLAILRPFHWNLIGSAVGQARMSTKTICDISDLRSHMPVATSQDFNKYLINGKRCNYLRALAGVATIFPITTTPLHVDIHEKCGIVVTGDDIPVKIPGFTDEIIKSASRFLESQTITTGLRQMYEIDDATRYLQQVEYVLKQYKIPLPVTISTNRMNVDNLIHKRDIINVTGIITHCCEYIPLFQRKRDQHLTPENFTEQFHKKIVRQLSTYRKNPINHPGKNIVDIYPYIDPKIGHPDKRRNYRYLSYTNKLECQIMEYVPKKPIRSRLPMSTWICRIEIPKDHPDMYLPGYEFLQKYNRLCDKLYDYFVRVYEVDNGEVKTYIVYELDEYSSSEVYCDYIIPVVNSIQSHIEKTMIHAQDVNYGSPLNFVPSATKP